MQPIIGAASVQQATGAGRPAHLEAKRLGREGFYSEYSIQVRPLLLGHAFKAAA
jgi:hypothetical protein